MIVLAPYFLKITYQIQTKIVNTLIFHIIFNVFESLSINFFKYKNSKIQVIEMQLAILIVYLGNSR